MRRLVALFALTALAVPVAASAHATLRVASPAPQSRLAAAPAVIRLSFDQAVSIGRSPIRVFAADGTRLDGAPRLVDEGRAVEVPVTGFKDGAAYTVRWQAVSPDGHTIFGVYTFGLGVEPPPPTEAVGASGPTWSDDLVRLALFVGFALSVGVIGFRLLVLPAAVPIALERRVHLVSTVAAFAAIDAGVAGLVLRGQDALQLSFVDLLYSDLSPLAERTRFGVAWMVTTVGLGALAALLLLAWVLDRPQLRRPAFVLGLLLLTAYPLSGHQATAVGSGLDERFADWAHLTAATLWVGGLVALAAIVWPLAPELRRAAFVRFSRLATACVSVLVAAGTYVAIDRLPDVADAWETPYGRVLLVKVALVSVALAWGAGHRFVVLPRLERGGETGGVVRSLLCESTVVMAVLLLAAILVNTSPPA